MRTFLLTLALTMNSIAFADSGGITCSSEEYKILINDERSEAVIYQVNDEKKLRLANLECRHKDNLTSCDNDRSTDPHYRLTVYEMKAQLSDRKCMEGLHIWLDCVAD